MSAAEIIVRGTIRPDGALELEKSPALLAGPVEVTIRPLPAASHRSEDWWTYLQRVRAEAEASGQSFRGKEEIDAEIEELRSGDERLDEVYRRIEAERQQTEQEVQSKPKK